MMAPEGRLSSMVAEEALSYRMGALLEGSSGRLPPAFGRSDADNGPVKRSFRQGEGKTFLTTSLSHRERVGVKGLPAELLQARRKASLRTALTEE